MRDFINEFLPPIILFVALFFFVTTCGDSKGKEKQHTYGRTITIVCQLPGGAVEAYQSKDQSPLWRGGWSFTTVEGIKILSSNCHSVQPPQKKGKKQ